MLLWVLAVTPKTNNSTVSYNYCGENRKSNWPSWARIISFLVFHLIDETPDIEACCTLQGTKDLLQVRIYLYGTYSVVIYMYQLMQLAENWTYILITDRIGQMFIQKWCDCWLADALWKYVQIFLSSLGNYFWVWCTHNCQTDTHVLDFTAAQPVIAL